MLSYSVVYRANSVRSSFTFDEWSVKTLLVRSITNVSEKFDRYFLPFIFPPFIVPRMNNISSVREFDTRLCKLDTVQTAQCHVRCRVTRIFLYTLEQGITRFKFSNSKRVMLIGLIRNAGWSKESVTGCRRSETRGILFLLLFDHVHACTDRQFVRTVILFHFHSSLFLKKKEIDTFPCGSSHPRTRYEAYFLYYLIPVSIEANRISNLICLKIVCA